MAMVQTKRLAALLLALLLTLFLLPSAWADSGVVGGTTVSGTVRVYLSSISSLTAVDVSIAGSYSVGGDASRALARGQNIRVSNSGGTLMMTADGQTQTMGSRFKLRRHQTSGENGVRIAQARYPASLYPGDIEFIAKGGNVQIIVHVYMEDYMLGVLPYEMDNSFPLEALKAQAIAAHSYALYCRDHAAEPASGWLSVDPVRRQGYLTDAVLRSYWGTAYEENYARLSALVDSVLTDVLYYGNAPAGTSYFAISNGMTEASENVWGTALPYLVAVDSSTDLNADNYLYTVQFTAEQMQQALAGLGLLPDPAAPASWFGEAALTPSGYVASLPVCGQSVTGPALRKALGLRSACFTVQYQEGSFLLTTKGYGHGVGLSQWGAKALAEQGQSAEEILAHYFPGTELRR